MASKSGGTHRIKEADGNLSFNLMAVMPAEFGETYARAQGI